MMTSLSQDSAPAVPLVDRVIEGLGPVQTLIEVPLHGAEGPIKLDGTALTLFIHPPQSPTLHLNLRALQALPDLEERQPETYADALIQEQAVQGRETAFLAHAVADWTVPNHPYSPQAFCDLMAQHPQLLEVARAQILAAFDNAGN